MDATVLALSILLHSKCAIPDKSFVHAMDISSHALLFEKQYKLQNFLLSSVVLAETGGRNIISKQRKNGGYDHGFAQIHSKQVDKSLLKTAKNIKRAAILLSNSKEICKRIKCICKWHAYNYLSKTWCKNVKESMDELKEIYNKQMSIFFMDFVCNKKSLSIGKTNYRDMSFSHLVTKNN